jgi:hypothetical protein
MRRRDFLSAGAADGLGLGSGTVSTAFSQAAKWPSKPPIPHRHAKTTRLFKAPGLYPNGLAISRDGLWIGQQKISAQQ